MDFIIIRNLLARAELISAATELLPEMLALMDQEPDPELLARAGAAAPRGQCCPRG